MLLMVSPGDRNVVSRRVTCVGRTHTMSDQTILLRSRQRWNQYLHSFYCIIRRKMNMGWMCTIIWFAATAAVKEHWSTTAKKAEERRNSRVRRNSDRMVACSKVFPRVPNRCSKGSDPIAWSACQKGHLWGCVPLTPYCTINNILQY